MATLKEMALEVLKEKGLKAVYVSDDNQIFTDKSLADLHQSTTKNAYEKIEAETVVVDLAKQVSDALTKTLTAAVADATIEKITTEEVKVVPIKSAKKGKETEKVTVAPLVEEVKTVAPTEEVKTVVPAEEVK